MSRYIPDSVVDEIRARADIADIVSGYLPLKRAGENWKACCPFHQEKTPSFTVNVKRQIFHCFGCGKGGDIFRFVMEKESVDFPNAVHILAAKYNVKIPETQERGEERSPAERAAAADSKERLYLLHEKIKAWFENNLWRDPGCAQIKAYLEGRGLPAETARKFGLGAAPDSWDAALNWGKRERFTEEEMLAAGIVTTSENSSRCYDRFRNRLIFPIWSEQGRVVAFSARTIIKDTKEAKYVNSPETPIFKKGRTLYALPLARQDISAKKSVILCEGQLDTIALHRAGCGNAVAPQGTAFTPEQAVILKRYSDRALLAFDSDNAGLQAVFKAAKILLPMDFKVGVIRFPGGKDPDELYKNSGAEAVTGSVDTAADFFDFLLQSASERHDLSSPAGKGAAADEIIEHINLVSNSVERAARASKLSQALGLPEKIIFDELNRVRHKAAAGSASRAASGAAASPDNGSLKQTAERLNTGRENFELAMESLLELSLSSGVWARRLETEFTPETLELTSAGRALETVIQMEINGEWELAAQKLAASLSERPDPVLSRILAGQSYESEPSVHEKLFTDCVKTVRAHLLKKEIDTISAEMAKSSDPAAQIESLGKLQALNKKMLDLRKRESLL